MYKTTTPTEVVTLQHGQTMLTVHENINKAMTKINKVQLQTFGFIASLHFFVPSIKVTEAQGFTVVQAVKQFDTIMEKLTSPKLGMKWLYIYAKKRMFEGDQQNGTQKWHF